MTPELISLERNHTVSQQSTLQETENTPPSSYFLAPRHLQGQNSLKYPWENPAICWSFHLSFQVRTGWCLMSFPQPIKHHEVGWRQHYLLFSLKIPTTSFPFPTYTLHSVLDVEMELNHHTLGTRGRCALSWSMPVHNRLCYSKLPV